MSHHDSPKAIMAAYERIAFLSRALSAIAYRQGETNEPAFYGSDEASGLSLILDSIAEDLMVEAVDAAIAVEGGGAR